MWGQFLLLRVYNTGAGLEWKGGTAGPHLGGEGRQVLDKNIRIKHALLLRLEVVLITYMYKIRIIIYNNIIYNI